MDLYGTEPVWLPTAEEAAAIDAAAQGGAGVPQRVLMENAGRSAALVLTRLFPEGPVLVLAGSGNNGGDAVVLARTLRAWGRSVRLVAAAPRASDAALLHDFDLGSVQSGQLGQALRDAAVVVDGLLGTGTRGAARSDLAARIQEVNAGARPVLALDLPSGVDATTGAVPGAAVRADVTVTFGWPKLGMLLQPARAHCGRIVGVEIGFPPLPPRPAVSGAAITPVWAGSRLPRRDPRAHKNSAGRVLALAGSARYGGAALLAATGALRAGAGVARLLSDASLRDLLLAALPEAIFGDRCAEPVVRDFVRAADALVAGPGMGEDEAARSALEAVLHASVGLPTLLDADALNILADSQDRLAALAAERQLVLTPHPGEMARLTGRTTAEITASPVEVAVEFATRIGGVVLLKGAPSIVAAPGEPVLVNTSGSSDLAKAGMGDTLAGVIGAFLARGVAPREAAGLGLFFTGRAADLAARGPAFTPGDAAAFLGDAFAAPGAVRSGLDLPMILFDQGPRH